MTADTKGLFGHMALLNPSLPAAYLHLSWRSKLKLKLLLTKLRT